jgi:anthranilate phosphoribosyltransferase
MIREAISRLVAGENISEDDSRQVAHEIMSGDATPTQIASFITALRIRGETVENIVGFARTMREKSTKIGIPAGEIILDTCGTGGDGVGTFNISTVAALIAAGAGIRVAKHGNRSVSSRCGSADVFERLGVKIDAPVEVSESCLREIGICFLFAPLFHPAMKFAVQPRREIGIRTIFNLVGPLSNPAQATHQLLGVYEPSLTEVFAHVLRSLGTRSALVVHGHDGLDEITTTSPTRVTELREDGTLRTYDIAPEEFGLQRATSHDLLGGDAEGNAGIVESILRGEGGFKADAALLNAGAALYIAGKASSIRDGIELARDSIESGSALSTLDALRRRTSQQRETE